MYADFSQGIDAFTVSLSSHEERSYLKKRLYALNVNAQAKNAFSWRLFV
jgi:hypothetical protein